MAQSTSHWQENHRGKVLGSFVVGDPVIETAHRATYKARTIVGDHPVELTFLKSIGVQWAALHGLGANTLTHEFRTAAAMGSTHIVRHISVGTTREGQPYIARDRVMDSVDSSLTRPCEFLIATSVVVDIAETVIRLHDHGLFHVPMQLGNLAVTRTERGDPGRCRLRDLGGLRWLDLPASPPAGLRAADKAPEEIAQEALDGRVDVFNLGRLFYELLTGKSPVGPEDGADDFMSGSAPLPAIRVGVLRPDLFEEIDLFLLKALHRTPRSRPRTVAHFMRGLHHLVSVFADANPTTQVPGDLWQRATPHNR